MLPILTFVDPARQHRRVSRPPAIGAALAAAVLVWALAAGGSWMTGDRQYVATVRVVVTPVGPDSVYRDHGLPKGGLDDAGAAAVGVARLLETNAVAEPVATRLRLAQEEALASISADADESGLIHVQGRANDGRVAAQIANAFATELVDQRNVRFQATTRELVRRVGAELEDVAEPAREAALEGRLAELRALLGTVDPSVELAGAAVAPAEPNGPAAWSAVAFGAPFGLLAALAVAVIARVRRTAPPSAAKPALRAEDDRSTIEERPAPPAAVGSTLGQDAAPKVGGSYSIETLHRLVAERSRDDPDCALELEHYLFYLRSYAHSDGALPRRFDALVEEAFGDLLPASG